MFFRQRSTGWPPAGLAQAREEDTYSFKITWKVTFRGRRGLSNALLEQYMQQNEVDAEAPEAPINWATTEEEMLQAQFENTYI